MSRWERGLIAGSALAPALTLIGCSLNPSRADVLGRYELQGIKAGRIVLSLRVDGTYNEDIYWDSKREDRRSGYWTLNGGYVSLSELWIPREFAPDYALDADKGTSTRMPKYTEPGNWNLSGEKIWGKTYLSVFPDSDIEFKKVHGS